MKQPRGKYVLDRFQQRMAQSLSQSRSTLFGEGFEDYTCYGWQDGPLKFYLTLRIHPRDDTFDMLITWMRTDKPPFFASTGAPDHKPNANGLSVDLSLFWSHHATPWKVKYSPDPENASNWMTRHPEVRSIASDPDKLKAYYYVDDAVDKFIQYGVPYLSRVKQDDS
jgi:hypothetical protein